jgi:hypothetical protein
MDDGMDGWKGRPPLTRCLEANVTSPKLHIPSKAPPTYNPRRRTGRTDTKDIIY